jgi:hypothetical protein
MQYEIFIVMMILVIISNQLPESFASSPVIRPDVKMVLGNPNNMTVVGDCKANKFVQVLVSRLGHTIVSEY